MYNIYSWMSHWLMDQDRYCVGLMPQYTSQYCFANSFIDFFADFHNWIFRNIFSLGKKHAILTPNLKKANEIHTHILNEIFQTFSELSSIFSLLNILSRNSPVLTIIDYGPISALQFSTVKFALLSLAIEMINNKARHNLMDANCKWRSDWLGGSVSFREPLGQTKVMQIRQGEMLNHQGAIAHEVCCLAAQLSKRCTCAAHGTTKISQSSI